MGFQTKAGRERASKEQTACREKFPDEESKLTRRGGGTWACTAVFNELHRSNLLMGQRCNEPKVSMLVPTLTSTKSNSRSGLTWLEWRTIVNSMRNKKNFIKKWGERERENEPGEPGWALKIGKWKTAYTRHKIPPKTQWANTNKIRLAAPIILELLFSMFCDL